jgi:DNA-binding winged helix-turn-helix (wHTH) protein
MKGDAHGRRVRFAAFEVDLRSCELFKHGIRIRLQDQPFQILAILLEQPGELIPREILRKKLWAEDTFVDFDAGLNAAIRRLRDALNDSADEPRYIETLPRHGYRFIAPVETIPEMKLELTAAVGEALRENESREPLLILQGESAHASPWPGPRSCG